MNSDYEKRALINTNNIQWEKSNTKGLLKKLLSSKGKEETALLKFEKDYQSNDETKINAVEIYVLEGTYINEYGKFNQGTYLKFQKENEALINTNNCVIFRKINHFENEEKIVINTKTSQWQQGQGKLQVMSLDMQSALVKWPKDEKFIPHKHWGGEEIFVLKGIFMDEYGKYPQGSWIRSPHLSEHFPYVEDETIIYVKTGHL